MIDHHALLMMALHQLLDIAQRQLLKEKLPIDHIQLITLYLISVWTTTLSELLLQSNKLKDPLVMSGTQLKTRTVDGMFQPLKLLKDLHREIILIDQHAPLTMVVAWLPDGAQRIKQKEKRLVAKSFIIKLMINSIMTLLPLKLQSEKHNHQLAILGLFQLLKLLQLLLKCMTLQLALQMMEVVWLLDGAQKIKKNIKRNMAIRLTITSMKNLILISLLLKITSKQKKKDSAIYQRILVRNLNTEFLNES